jgi:carboxymethylenebutenolidase
VDVYAVDLYDGKVATTAAEAKKLSTGLDAKRGASIINGVLSLAGQNKNIATLGWCMGGTWSLTATLLARQQAKACVMYYGFPEQDSAKVSKLQCDVLYNWASKDNFITKDKVDVFQQKVEASKHNFILHTFNADHAFANPSNPKHDPVATEEANSYALKFLKEKLQLE